MTAAPAVVLLAALLLAAAVAVLPAPAVPSRRLAALRLRPPGPRRSGVLAARLPRVLAAVGLGAAALVIAGPWPTALTGAVTAVTGVLRHRRRRAPSVPRGSVALAADVMAGALQAGLRLPTVLRWGATVVPGPPARALERVASDLEAGIPPDDAWAALERCTELAAVGRCCRRSAVTGAAMGDDLRRLAERLRRAARADAERRVARASVWLVLPLGGCFLPAFVLVTVVPIVVGLVAQLTRQ